MILRQNLPMAVRVNVVPMRRRKRGLGDTCTPTSCAGPYPEDVYNYDYWLEQAHFQGKDLSTVGSNTETIDTTEIANTSSNASGDWASYSQMAQAACVENCGIYTTVSDQYACSQRNAQRDIQISNLQAKYNSAVPASALSELTCATPIPSGGTPTFSTGPTPAAPSSPPPPSVSASQHAATYPNASVTFLTPRGSGPLYPGDAWTIKISGAAPNSPVAVTGNGSAATYGTNITTPMGTTDSSGNWALSGSIDSSQIGQWYENWSVGGQSVGSFSFTVQASPSSTTGTGVQYTASPSPTAVAASTGNWLTDSMFGGIPNWGQLAAAAVAVFAFSSGGRR